MRTFGNAIGLTETAMFLWALFTSAGCGGIGTPTISPNTIDAVSYFPLETGRYWVFFDSDDRFVTLEFVRLADIVGTEAHVLTYTYDHDTLHGEPIEPFYEEYYVNEPDKGVVLLGYQDYESGLSATYLPAVIVAGNEMEIGVPVVTTTAESGRLTSYVATLVAHGIVQTYFGDFDDAIDIISGPEDGEQPKHFYARGKGPVKFDRQGARFQLYDYGVRSDGG